ncbi:MAG: superoxide dismutase [Ni] [Akkermansiaceae bacterium]
MKNYLTLAAVLSAFFFIAAPQASAHCEVPCGIFSDDNVIKELHVTQQTIAKSMVLINELSKDPSKNANQLTRWVMTKENHAIKIQNTMLQYFLAQRIKLAEMESDKESYLNKLTLAHKVIVLAMKSKQTTDEKTANALHDAIHAFEKAYAAKK